jgi:diguanylate cyclase (GGDEF)-like protein
MLRLQNLILELVAKGESLARTMERLCLEIELLLPDVVCSLLTVDQAGLLHPLASPSLPPEYCQAIDGLPIGPNAGSCGTAAYFANPVTVTDIAHDPRWANYRGLVLPLGFTACWSSPIRDARGRVLGTFAFYYRECRGPSDLETQLVETCVNLCTIAMERHERVMERERLANVDGLTGLANRACFNTALAGLPCDEPGSWALLIADLDNLKVVNDTFGHQTGDALIREVAARLDAACRPDRTFRIGGDEFAIVVQEAESLRDIDAMAERILHWLAEPVLCNGHLIQPKATIGGAILSYADRFAESVRQNADFALYHAKETGRGGLVRYWPGIGTAITHRLSAIRDVQAALDDGRIDAWYQPIVRLDTRAIVGLEALCRLTTERGEVLPAAAFCEATADAHVASALTETMLSRIASDIRTWLDLGVPFGHVGINIASADFHLGRLNQQITRALDLHRVSLDHLVIEVAEDVYLGQRDNVVAREIKAMRARGLRVALDDFGTGFASLTHLLTVPVDFIKIDKSFTARLAPGDASGTIIEGIFRIAEGLGITVVAEGIETEAQAEQLRGFGGALGQGYLFARPIGREAATRMLREGVLRPARPDGPEPATGDDGNGQTRRRA